MAFFSTVSAADPSPAEAPVPEAPRLSPIPQDLREAEKSRRELETQAAVQRARGNYLRQKFDADELDRSIRLKEQQSQSAAAAAALPALPAPVPGTASPGAASLERGPGTAEALPVRTGILSIQQEARRYMALTDGDPPRPVRVGDPWPDGGRVSIITEKGLEIVGKDGKKQFLVP